MCRGVSYNRINVNKLIFKEGGKNMLNNKFIFDFNLLIFRLFFFNNNKSFIF